MTDRDAGVRVITEPLGGSELARASQAGALPVGIQPWWPRTATEWSAHASRIRAAANADWLASLAPAFGVGGPAQERLARAAREGIVVTTGQQAGLFGGPLYTLSKALSALTLADVLEGTLGIPVAPVFWAATDDADFLEAAAVHIAGADGVERLALADAPPAGTPMSRTPLGDVAGLLRQLHRACGSTAHARFFELTRVAFSSERTLGGAYVRQLRELLEPLGMAVLDASHPAVRAASAPILRRALARASEVHEALAARSEAIRSAGFEPQVGDDRGLSLVFAHENGVKRRLSMAEARAEPAAGAALSPNVLLRPVMERALLPTAGYVAGPGELAYFAQVDAVARTLDVAAPVGLPRWSGTVVEAPTLRALSRLGIDAGEAADVHALEARFARAAIPPAVGDAWTRLAQRLSASIDELDAAVRDSTLVPPPVIEGLRRSLAHKLGRTERRLLAAAKRRDDQVRRDVALVTASLYPLGKRQERVLSFVPMLARSGDALLGAMIAAARQHATTLVAAARDEVVATR